MKNAKHFLPAVGMGQADAENVDERIGGMCTHPL